MQPETCIQRDGTKLLQGGRCFMAMSQHAAPEASRALVSNLHLCKAPNSVCVMQVPVPTVTEQERLLFQKMPYAGVYRCVVRCEYG